MSCPNYEPAFQKQLPQGPNDCLCYAGAMGGDYHTCGKIVPTGKRVRQLTGDTVGGTTLTEVDDALRRGWKIDLDVRQRITRVEFWQGIRNGRAGVIYLDYSSLRGTKWGGSATFGGTHGELITDVSGNECRKFDPLSDGRRPGFCNDAPRGTWTPISVIDRAMDGLLDDHGRQIGVQGGVRLAWVGFTRDNEPDWLISVAKGRAYATYVLNAAGRVIGRSHAVVAKTSFTGLCSAPTSRLVANAQLRKLTGPSVRLVHVENGPLKGKWVNAVHARER